MLYDPEKEQQNKNEKTDKKAKRWKKFKRFLRLHHRNLQRKAKAVFER
jgi:hypothetical protein